MSKQKRKGPIDKLYEDYLYNVIGVKKPEKEYKKECLCFDSCSEYNKNEN